MDFGQVLQAIATVGFPIIACIGIAWFFNRVNENYRSDIKELSKAHQEETKTITDKLSEEIKALNESIQNNTLVLQKLIDKFDKEESL